MKEVIKSRMKEDILIPHSEAQSRPSLKEFPDKAWKRQRGVFEFD